MTDKTRIRPLTCPQRISGHKTLAMVERYSHQNGEHIQAAMDKLQKQIKVVNR